MGGVGSKKLGPRLLRIRHHLGEGGGVRRLVGDDTLLIDAELCLRPHRKGEDQNWPAIGGLYAQSRSENKASEAT